MAKPPDSLTLMLTGQLPFILITAAVLAFPVSFLLLRFYRRVVLKSMDRQAGAASNVSTPDLTPGPAAPKPTAPLEISNLQAQKIMPLTPEAQTRYAQAVSAPWWAAAVYSLGGICYAGIMAVAFLIATKITFLPMRFLLLAWIFGWPLTCLPSIHYSNTAFGSVFGGQVS